MLLLLIALLCHSQDGVIRYGEIQSMGMGAPVGPDYNAVLLFDTKRSLYITRKDSLEGGNVYKTETFKNGERTFIMTVNTIEEGIKYYNDLTESSFLSKDVGERFVKEKTQKINWSIEEETKIIGGYECQKATTHFRGRDYTVWFTTKIPVPYGPWKLQGLPGAILEAYDTHKEIYWYFKSLEYPAECSDVLKPIEGGNLWLNFEEYRASVISSYKRAIIAGRMGAESIGVKGSQDTKQKMNTSSSYIEGFEFEF